MLFVGAERSSIVGVYDVSDPANPVLTQLLPSGIGPEGYAVIEERGLLVSANETDDAGRAPMSWSSSSRMHRPSIRI
jgi:hypothetical protein